MTTQQTKNFVLAGKATFTVSNGRPAPLAADYTYRVNFNAKSKLYFVSYLTGSDNEHDYTYLGVLNPATGKVTTTYKSYSLDGSKPHTVVNWALGKVWAGQELPGGASLQHAGKCGKCARTLTVPESIECGLGPECSGQGYTKPRNERKPRAKKAAKPTFAQARAAANLAAQLDPASFSLGAPAPAAEDIDTELGGDYDGTLDYNEARVTKPLAFVSQSPYAGRQIAEVR